MSTKKVLAVLGVGPALGGAVAKRFAQEEYAVALMARSSGSLTPLEEAITAAGGRALAIPTDATDPAQVAAAFARIREQLGEVDVFVYNAGAFRMGGILELSAEDFEQSWRANCLGGFLGAREVLPGMVKRGSGTILFTGATASLRGSAKFSGLAVGKFGLRALAQSTAREFGAKGVHVVHVVIDGQIGTPRVRSTSPEREAYTMLSPDAIAETYWQLHSQDRTAWTLEIDLRPAVEKF